MRIQLAILATIMIGGLYSPPAAANTELEQAIAAAEEAGWNYTVLIKHNPDGSYTYYLVIVNSASYVQFSNQYNTFGGYLSGGPTSGDELLGDYIEGHDLSVDQSSCASFGLCLDHSTIG